VKSRVQVHAFHLPRGASEIYGRINILSNEITNRAPWLHGVSTRCLSHGAETGGQNKSEDVGAQIPEKYCTLTNLIIASAFPRIVQRPMLGHKTASLQPIPKEAALDAHRGGPNQLVLRISIISCHVMSCHIISLRRGAACFPPDQFTRGGQGRSAFAPITGMRVAHIRYEDNRRLVLSNLTSRTIEYPGKCGSHI